MNEEKDFRQRLEREFIDRGLLTKEKFKACLKEAQTGRKSLVEVLFSSSGAQEKDVVAVLCLVCGYSPINVKTFVIEPEVLKLIPKDKAKKYGVLPISQFEKTLTVAISDPLNLQMLDDLRVLTRLRIKPVLALPSQLEEAILKYYGDGSRILTTSSESFEEIIQELRSQLLNPSFAKGLGDPADLLEEAKATPVIRLVNHLLIEAIRRRASDVFVEPWERMMRVRYRVDGVLEEVLSISRALVGAVISRIKVMSRLNIAEHRVPQDGRFKARIFGREADVRVSILPTCHGEKACLRILDTTAEQRYDLDRLGFGPDELEIIRRVSVKPHGMILLTGPTGSGKTTTLYAVLQYLDTPEKNITTVEDPVEYQVPGINQVNVREQVGLTFPTALRSILRQDPDIILIGEIRDQVTMDIAIKAALTGHLVLSTLHTNDATSAIVRMINMGVEPFLIASSVLMVSAQRLVRKLCPLCRAPYTPERELLESLNLPSKEKLTFYRATGCPRCRSTGFQGRTVVTELFEMRPEILDLIMKGGSAEELRRLARQQGMKTLRESGVEKVKAGITAIEEVLRVTSPEPVLQTQEA